MAPAEDLGVGVAVGLEEGEEVALGGVGGGVDSFPHAWSSTAETWYGGHVSLDAFSRNPDGHLSLLRDYQASYEKDRTVLAGLVESGLVLLDGAPESVKTAAIEWRSRIEGLRLKIEAAAVEPTGGAGDIVLRELEALSANEETRVPSEVHERHSLAVALYQLRAAEMEALIRGLVELNNQIVAALK